MTVFILRTVLLEQLRIPSILLVHVPFPLVHRLNQQRLQNIRTDFMQRLQIFLRFIDVRFEYRHMIVVLARFVLRGREWRPNADRLGL